MTGTQERLLRCKKNRLSVNRIGISQVFLFKSVDCQVSFVSPLFVCSLKKNEKKKIHYLKKTKTKRNVTGYSYTEF